MGCSLCRGHAHQVCGAPGCHDETKEVEESYRRQQAEWYKLDNVIMCSYCHVEPAIWRNGRGDYRCSRCPRFF